MKIKLADMPPIHDISALTREGCQNLIHAIYGHVAKVQAQEQGIVETDVRFDLATPPDATADGYETDPRDPRFR
jgi:GTP-binding protein